MIRQGPREAAGPEGDGGGATQVAEDHLLERLGFWLCFLRADPVGKPTAMTGHRVRKLSHWAQDTPWSKVEMVGGGWNGE